MALAGVYEYWRRPEVKQDDDPTPTDSYRLATITRARAGQQSIS